METTNILKDIMTPNPICVFPEDSFKKVKKIFKKNKFHHLPVIEKNGEIIGIISKNDCLIQYQRISEESSGKRWSKKYLKSLTAKSIMHEAPLTLEPEDHIGLAADIFMANEFHALPIQRGEEIIGIVTTHDLIKFAFK